MRKIKLRRIFDAFSKGASHLSRPLHEVPFYLTHRRAFNTLSLTLILSALCLISYLLLGKKLLLAVGLAFGILYFLLNEKTKKVSQGLSFKRSLPNSGSAGDEITVNLDVINASPFVIEEVQITENFLGTQSPPEEFYILEIKPFSKTRLQYKAKLNAGTGPFGFEPIKAVIGDSLSLTWAEITDESQVQTIEVFPKVRHLPDVPLKASSNSTHYGTYDVQAPSVSVNFVGVREYKHGDSLKHISWRLSARRQELVVKEFEKSVNVEVAVLLDMDAQKHAGVKADSTWEVVKDLGLGLLAQEVAEGNSVQVISQEFYLPAGRGEAQSHFAVLTLGQLKPVPSAQPLLDIALPLLPKSCTILYVTPCFIESFYEELQTLRRLRAEGFDIYVFLIEPNSYFRNQVHSINEAVLAPNDRALRQMAHEDLFRDLATSGIHCYWIDKPQGLAKALLRDRSQEVRT